MRRLTREAAQQLRPLFVAEPVGRQADVTFRSERCRRASTCCSQAPRGRIRPRSKSSTYTAAVCSPSSRLWALRSACCTPRACRAPTHRPTACHESADTGAGPQGRRERRARRQFGGQQVCAVEPGRAVGTVRRRARHRQVPRPQLAQQAPLRNERVRDSPRPEVAVVEPAGHEAATPVMTQDPALALRSRARRRPCRGRRASSRARRSACQCQVEHGRRPDGRGTRHRIASRRPPRARAPPPRRRLLRSSVRIVHDPERRCLPFRYAHACRPCSPRRPRRSACCACRRSATSATRCRSCARCRTRGPTTQLTWILGKLEHKLLGHIPGIEFIVFDKKAGLEGYRELRAAAARPALRRAAAHAAGTARQHRRGAWCPARYKLGFDRARAREVQWLFTNAKIAPRSREHVLDSLFGFAERLGVDDSGRCAGTSRCRRARCDYAATAIPEPRNRRWSSARARATRCATGAPNGTRRWPITRSHATACEVLLCGGRSALELQYGARDRAAHAPAVPQPDRQGHAARIPGDAAARHGAGVARFRTGAHGDDGRHAGHRALCRHQSANAAARITAVAGAWIATTWRRVRFRNRRAADLPWTEKIEVPGVMDLIEVDDAIEKLDELMAAGAPRTPTAETYPAGEGSR